MALREVIEGAILLSPFPQVSGQTAEPPYIRWPSYEPLLAGFDPNAGDLGDPELARKLDPRSNSLVWAVPGSWGTGVPWLCDVATARVMAQRRRDIAQMYATGLPGAPLGDAASRILAGTAADADYLAVYGDWRKWQQTLQLSPTDPVGWETIYAYAVRMGWIAVAPPPPPPPGEPPPPPVPTVRLSIQADRTSVRVGEVVTLSATPSGGIPPYIRFEWAFGDGNFNSTGVPQVQYAYPLAGNFRVLGAVTDSTNNRTTASGPVITVSGELPPGGGEEGGGGGGGTALMLLGLLGLFGLVGLAGARRRKRQQGTQPLVRR